MDVKTVKAIVGQDLPYVEWHIVKPSPDLRVSFEVFGSGHHLIADANFVEKEGIFKIGLLDVFVPNVGIGKKVFQNLIMLSKDLHLPSLSVDADLEYGAYFWARMGFVPDVASWQALKPKLAKRLLGLEVSPAKGLVEACLKESDPKAIWTIADSKLGKELLPGLSWEGTLDLHDPEAMRRTEAYLAQGKHVAQTAADHGPQHRGGQYASF